MSQTSPATPPAASPWWTPHVHADRRAFLLARNRIQAALRGMFDARGFLEVDPACLAVSPGNELHLHPFATQLVGPDRAEETRYLATSPEFACKKLLAAGETRIVAFAHAFRNRERTALHHPEFTMLEWYRVQEPYTVLMDDCAAVIALAAETAGARRMVWRGREADPYLEPERLSVAEAFVRFAGIDVMATIAADGATDRDALAAAVRLCGLRVAADDSWSDLFSRVLTAMVEPNLGLGRVTVLDAYPIPEAALAQPSAPDRRLAERFEVYACGVELANGFGELTDAAEQRRRFVRDMAEKGRLYGEAPPVDDDFLAALALMPPACGVALGFDRLVMLAAGATHIEQVLWAPVAEVTP